MARRCQSKYRFGSNFKHEGVHARIRSAIRNSSTITRANRVQNKYVFGRSDEVKAQESWFV